MSDDSRPESKVTTSIPQTNSLPKQSFAARSNAEAIARDVRLSGAEGPREFVLVVVHNQSGRVFSPFLVRADDEEAARKLCRRNYLEIRSVEPFVEVEGKKKPRTLTYGPPISDTDFEEDYGNRDADPSPTSGVSISWFGVVGGLLCGPVGSLVGLLFHQAIDEPRRRD
jgi:hypothetical protein